MLGIGLQPHTEYVLTDGMVITAETPEGHVRIAGRKGTKRIYSGDVWSKRGTWIRAISAGMDRWVSTMQRPA